MYKITVGTQRISGFSVSNARPGEKVDLLANAFLTSDDNDFHRYMNLIYNYYLSKTGMPARTIHRFVIVLHQDLKADIYLNDFQMMMHTRYKRKISIGEKVYINDIADIDQVSFPEVSISEKDCIIYCFREGWKFGLYFDFKQFLPPETKLNVANLNKVLGKCHSYLLFQNVYDTLQNEIRLSEMSKDGWFPFIQLLGSDYDLLFEIYENKFDFENRIQKFVNGFTKDRIEKFIQYWWENSIFSEKKSILEAGIKGYAENTAEGFITCIKTIYSEIYGILTIFYFDKYQKAGKIRDLIQEIKNEVVIKTASDLSLLLPKNFGDYLENVFFKNFNLETDELDLSRHSVDHGLAKVEDYNKMKALQGILILDQLSFYLK